MNNLILKTISFIANNKNYTLNDRIKLVEILVKIIKDKALADSVQKAQEKFGNHMEVGL